MEASPRLDFVTRVAPVLTRRLRERMEEFLEGAAVKEERLLQEVAILAERADVTEELVRLESLPAESLGVFWKEFWGRRDPTPGTARSRSSSRSQNVRTASVAPYCAAGSDTLAVRNRVGSNPGSTA